MTEQMRSAASTPECYPLLALLQCAKVTSNTNLGMPHLLGG
jgi:hypothetical protein